MSFLENLNFRYATKKFDNTKEVSEENLQKIRDAIRMAPTSFGLQMFSVVEVSDMFVRENMKAASWDQPQILDAHKIFVFCRRVDAENRINKMFEAMSGGDEEVRKNSLAMYEGMVRGSVSPRSKEELMDWSGRQAYIALGFAMAACAELKIDSCPMEGFDPVKIKEILNLGDDFMPAAYLAVGYRAEDDASASRPKFRLPESEIISKI